jgi:hypothetical protein
MNRYLRKDVTWMSQVFAIHKRPESMRVELLVKVLPDSILYDTVLVIEGNTQLDSRIQKGSWITFTGRIFNGVDALGVKEVQVLLKDPSALRLFEKSPEEQYILPTSN